MLFDRLLETVVPKGQLTLLLPGQAPRTFGPGGGKSVTVRLHDRKVALDLVANPRLAIGEAYMDGRLTVEDGTILDLLELVVGANRWEDGGKGRKAMGKSKLKKLRALFRRNQPQVSRRNVAHHYDLSDELYESFLDPDMQYSCAYYTDPTNSLEQAQADKKAHIAAKLYLQPGQRVLDIGCGWGGTALYLNRVADVDVLGVTLSEHQLAIARRRAEEAGVADRVRFELIDYRKVEGRFDRIVSVGMFEHVGLAHFDEFFAKCRDLLAEDGVMLLHTIGKLGKAGAAPDPFVDKYIFPGGYLPSLSDIVGSSRRARLIISDVETLRLHYALTVREWLRRFTAARPRMVKLYDERFCRMWEFYLVGRDRVLRGRRGLQLPAAIHPRPPRAADHPRLHRRGRGALSVDEPALALRLGAPRLAQRLTLGGRHLAIAIGIGAIEPLERGRLQFGLADLAVAIDVGGGEQAGGNSAVARLGRIRARFRRDAQLRQGQEAVAILVGTVEHPACAAAGAGRGLALGGQALAHRGFGLGPGDLAVLVRVQPGEHPGGIVIVGARLDLVAARPGPGVDLGLGDEAVAVAIERRELFRNVRGKRVPGLDPVLSRPGNGGSGNGRGDQRGCGKNGPGHRNTPLTVSSG